MDNNIGSYLWLSSVWFHRLVLATRRSWVRLWCVGVTQNSYYIALCTTIFLLSWQLSLRKCFDNSILKFLNVLSILLYWLVAAIWFISRSKQKSRCNRFSRNNKRQWCRLIVIRRFSSNQKVEWNTKNTLAYNLFCTTTLRAIAQCTLVY